MRFPKLPGYAICSDHVVSIIDLIFNLTAFLGELFGTDEDVPSVSVFDGPRRIFWFLQKTVERLAFVVRLERQNSVYLRTNRRRTSTLVKFHDRRRRSFNDAYPRAAAITHKQPNYNSVY